MADDPERNPDGGAAARRGLAARLRRRIAEAGPIAFAEFMDAALYDPEAGFYAGVPVGERGDFVTSPHVSPAFAALLGRQVEELWHLVDRPDPFDIVEVGAGDGTLARQLLAALPDGLSAATRYAGVERSPGARRALTRLAADLADGAGQRAPLAFEVHADQRSVPGRRTGLVLANEVFDNVPVHRLRGVATGSGPLALELHVAFDEQGFALVEAGPAPPHLADLAPPLGPGEEVVVAPAALDLLDDMARMLDRGCILVIDYAARTEAGERPAARPHAYRAHAVDLDVLSDPGSRDITSGVDFAALTRHAARRGLTVWGPVTQHDALLALGFRDLERQARQRQVEAIEARRGIDALRVYTERTRANLLLAPDGLGGFLWVLFGVNVPRTAVPRAIGGPAVDRA
jgi:SAM-dependent MidA family methyltransferase